MAPIPSSPLSPSPAHGTRLQQPGAPLIHGFLVRKAEKSHGTGRRIEGFLERDAPVLIVDDVCTTGASTITAIEAAREAGMKVIAAVCLSSAKKPPAAPPSKPPASPLPSCASSPPTTSAPRTSASSAKSPHHTGGWRLARTHGE